MTFRQHHWKMTTYVVDAPGDAPTKRIVEAAVAGVARPSESKSTLERTKRHVTFPPTHLNQILTQVGLFRVSIAFTGHMYLTHSVVR
jgi:hypothetical protein